MSQTCLQTAEAAPATSGGARPSRREWIVPLAIIGVILLATIAAYSNILFNFFNGDDYCHLEWLPQAVKQPELIWRNFHTSWLEGNTTRFYRPLISVFNVFDYLIWGINGLGYHITNLLFHLSSSVFLYFIVRDFAPGDRSVGSTDRRWWALFACALFALYPLHPEAVSWWTGRVDTAVAFFSLGSFYGYLRWRQTGSKPWVALSTLFFCLGLSSKEMAIVMPALFATWEFFFGTTASGLVARARHAVWKSLPFWGVLALYFCVRRFALGTFVGGYDDSLTFIANPRMFVISWLHALRTFVVPINKEFLGAHSFLTKGWEVLMTLSAVLMVATVLKCKPAWKQFGFMSLWLLLCLVPVYKLFNITDDLQGSRLGYSASAPLAVLLAFYLSNLSRSGALLKYVKIAAAVGLSILAGAILYINNFAWVDSGVETAHIQSALQKFYAQTPGDPEVLIVALPDNVHGGYVCRNAISGMTKVPQLQRNIYHCNMAESFEQILPFAFLKPSLAAAHNEVHLLRWDSKSASLVPIVFPESSDTLQAKWNGLPLDRIAGLKPVGRESQPNRGAPAPSDCAKFLPEGTLEVRGTGSKSRPTVYLDTRGVPCWNVDFIAVDVQLLPDDSTARRVADLFYTNDLVPEYQLVQRTSCFIRPGETNQRLIFPLHNLSNWALGGNSRGMKLSFPDNCHMIVKSISAVSSAGLIPKIDFANSGFTGTKGFLHISDSKPRADIIFDVGQLPGASGIMLEVTRPNVYFEEQNTSRQSSATLHRVTQPGTKGTITLPIAMFPMIGLYEVRGWAINSAGKPMGIAGDHIVISRD